MSEIEAKTKELEEMRETLESVKDARDSREEERNTAQDELDDFEIPEHEVERMLDDSIDEAGTVTIVGIEFSRSHIVKRLDPIAYSEARNNLEDSMRDAHPRYKELESAVEDAQTDIDGYNDEIDDLERDILTLSDEIYDLEMAEEEDDENAG